MSPSRQAPSADANHWDQRYQEGADGWELGQPAPPLAQLLRCHPLASQAPGRVMVPGCGRGHEVALLEDCEARRLHGEARDTLEWLQATITVERKDPEEAGFEHEGHRTLEAQHRPEEITGELGKRGPVGAELEFQRQPGGHADAEIEHIELRPEAGLPVVQGVACAQPDGFQHHQINRQAGGEHRPEHVKDRRQSELGISESSFDDRHDLLRREQRSDGTDPSGGPEQAFLAEPVNPLQAIRERRCQSGCHQSFRWRAPVGIAIELSDQQAQALSETARRLHVSEADLAAAACGIWFLGNRLIFRPLRIAFSTGTKSSIAGWPDQTAKDR